MKIDTFYPKHPLLKNHIEYYYFQKTDTSDFSADYYSFPNTLQALNIHKNISCESISHQVKITGIEADNYIIVLQGRNQLPLHVLQKGKINKVTIIFKPLGLNHFIKSPFNRIANEPTQIFNEWIHDKDYLPFLNLFYTEPDNNRRIIILESFLLHRYIPFIHAAVLKKSLEMLCDFDMEYSIETVAEKIQLNPRTFSRLFCKHLGVPPVVFRKIARFRDSLKNKIFETQFTTLTKIAYGSNFCDQSYFNKIYKKITSENPSRFFSSIDQLADNQLIFKFVNK